MTAPSTFAALHHGRAPLLLANAWDVASGLLLEAAGAPAVGTTSLGVTAAMGLGDGVRAGRAATITLGSRLASRLTVPVSVDLEDGFSDDPAAVAELATQLSSLGVAGINLEDGRSDGQLRPMADHAAVIAAVTAAAPNLFVNARTDTYWAAVGNPHGRLAETIQRLVAYRDAGASGVFVPGVSDLTAVRRIATAVTAPLNVLWHQGTELSDLVAAGVARISTGSALYRAALSAAVASARSFWLDGAPATAPVDYGYLQQLLEVRRVGHRLPAEPGE